MLELINTYLLGIAVPVCLILCGIGFTVYLHGYPFRKLKTVLRSMTRPRQNGETSPIRAMTLALAGTLGVGNIVGVSGAVLMGGAGAVFWMWLSSAAAMILKYAEVLLAVRHRRTDENGRRYGGAYYYIKEYFSRHPRVGSAISCIFAVLCILNAFSMGSVVQSNAVASAWSGTTGIAGWLVGGVLAVLTGVVIVKGTHRIAALTEVLVPAMSAVYLLLCFAVIVICRDGLCEVFSRIFTEAFQPMGAVGGVLGFVTSKSLRYGTMRGLISNEAGCGTAPTAHAAADTDSPAEQGFLGVFEVFADTILLCTVSAVVLLLQYDAALSRAPDGMQMALGATSNVLGGWSEYVLCLAVTLFGFATLVCWANYGAECVRFLTGRKSVLYLYRFAFCVCVFLGSVTAPESIWTVADFSIGCMTLINLTVLCLMRREIKSETFSYFGIQKRPVRIPRKRSTRTGTMELN